MTRRVAWVLLMLLMASSLMVVAYRPFMNETGNTAYGLRVVFSEPVELTGFGDTLSEVSPDGIAEEYLFTGGEVDAWTGVHWVSWEPAHAQVVSHEWIMTPPGSEPSGEQGLEVWVTPDRAIIGPGNHHVVTYVFRNTRQCGVSLTQRTGQFYTETGDPLGEESGRMHQGTSVPAEAEITWQDNIYMPPWVAEEARELGVTRVVLTARFYGVDCEGDEVVVPVDLVISYAEESSTPAQIHIVYNLSEQREVIGVVLDVDLFGLEHVTNGTAPAIVEDGDRRITIGEYIYWEIEICPDAYDNEPGYSWGNRHLKRIEENLNSSTPSFQHVGEVEYAYYFDPNEAHYIIIPVWGTDSTEESINCTVGVITKGVPKNSSQTNP